MNNVLSQEAFAPAVAVVEPQPQAPEPIKSNFFFPADTGAKLHVILKAPVDDPYLLIRKTTPDPTFTVKVEGTIEEILSAIKAEIADHNLNEGKFDPVILINGARGSGWNFKSAGGECNTMTAITERIERVLSRDDNQRGITGQAPGLNSRVGYRR